MEILVGTPQHGRHHIADTKVCLLAQSMCSLAHGLNTTMFLIDVEGYRFIGEKVFFGSRLAALMIPNNIKVELEIKGFEINSTAHVVQFLFKIRSCEPAFSAGELYCLHVLFIFAGLFSDNQQAFSLCSCTESQGSMVFMPESLPGVTLDLCLSCNGHSSNKVDFCLCLGCIKLQ